MSTFRGSYVENTQLVNPKLTVKLFILAIYSNYRLVGVASSARAKQVMRLLTITCWDKRLLWLHIVVVWELNIVLDKFSNLCR